MNLFELIARMKAKQNAAPPMQPQPMIPNADEFLTRDKLRQLDDVKAENANLQRLGQQGLPPNAPMDYQTRGVEVAPAEDELKKRALMQMLTRN